MENKIALSKITKATTELMKSQKAQNTAAEALKELIQEAEEVSKKIQELEIEKNTLAEELEISKRENKIELGLSVKENEEEVLQNILDTRSLETINPEELEELRETADRATSELKEEIQKAVDAAIEEKRIKDQLAKSEADKEVAVERATNQAKIDSFETQIDNERKVSEDLRVQLSAEREAGVKRAEAAGSMTINTGSK